MKRETKENICGGSVMIGFFLIFNIVGNVECGGSVWNMLWCVPILAVLFVMGLWMDYRPKRRIRVKRGVKK